MKYQGLDIEGTPMLELITSYMTLRKHFVATPMEVFKFWEKKKWTTKKGTEVMSLEVAVDVCNSMAVQRERRAKRMSKKKNKVKKAQVREVVDISPIPVKPQKTKEEIIEDRKKSGTDIQTLCNEEYKKNHPQDANMSYTQQLNDSRWHSFRKHILSVRGHRCELCGSKQSIQIHHPVYFNGRKAWEYTCNEVVVLCQDCHKAVHNKQ